MSGLSEVLSVARDCILLIGGNEVVWAVGLKVAGWVEAS